MPTAEGPFLIQDAEDGPGILTSAEDGKFFMWSQPDGRVIMVAPPSGGSQIIGHFGGYSIQQATDGPGALTIADNAKALTWNQASGHFVMATVNAADADTLDGLDSTAFLLADGTRTGATSQAQTFTNGIVGPSWRPASDSTTAMLLRNAANNASLMTFDTTNMAVGILGGATARRALTISKPDIVALAGENWIGQNTVWTDTSTASSSHFITAGNYTSTSSIGTGVSNTGFVRGISCVAFQNGDGSASTVSALFGQAGSSAGSGTITSLRGLQFSLIKAAGTTISSLAYGLDIGYDVATSNLLAGINIQASSAAAVTKYGIFIDNVTGGSANSYAIFTNAGIINFGGSASLAAWGTAGAGLRTAAATYTNSSTASGTVTNAVFNSFGRPTLAATNASITTTNAATVYIANSPLAGTNQTLTNKYAVWVDDGDMRLDGNLLIGQTGTPTAGVDILAGTTAQASLRMRVGVAPTTPNDGDHWYDGAFTFYATDATTAAIVDTLRLRRASSGTPAAGFGVGVSARLASSTTANQDAGRLTWEWIVATHASRASKGQLTSFYTATEKPSVTWGSNSTVALLSFYDVVSPIARQVLATGAGRTVDDVITALQALGLVKQS